MTRTFELGPDAKCDLDKLVDTRLLVNANSGGGKSWCIRRILEQTHGKVQHLVIDPEGEFSTLREKFDYVLAARTGGDTAADPRSAKLLAERLLDLKVSAILDIYELKAHERIRFVRAFLEALVDAPKSLWHPVLVVLDEAHVFAPQAGEAESAGAVIDLMTRGRKRGFAGLLATQRLSKLHKDAAAEANNVVIGRTGLDIDMKRAADMLGLVGRDEVHALRTLAPGEFHAFGPAFAPGVNRVVVGPVATSHPKAGSRIAFTAPPPTEKVRALLPQLADLPAEAEERARTLEELKRENAALKRDVIRLADGKPEARVERIEVPLFDAEQQKSIGCLIDEAKKLRNEIALLAGGAEGIDRQISALTQDVMGVVQAKYGYGVARPAVVRSETKPGRREPIRPVRCPKPPVRDTNATPHETVVGIAPARQRILDALAYFASIGLDTVDRTQLALFADASPTSSGYANNLGALRTLGLVEYPAGATVGLTEAGRDVANVPDTAPTVEEMHESLRVRLAPAKWKIIEALIAAYPDALERDELAEKCGASATSSGFANNLGALRSLGLLDYPIGGWVVALPVLFLEGA